MRIIFPRVEKQRKRQKKKRSKPTLFGTIEFSERFVLSDHFHHQGLHLNVSNKVGFSFYFIFLYAYTIVFAALNFFFVCIVVTSSLSFVEFFSRNSQRYIYTYRHRELYTARIICLPLSFPFEKLHMYRITLLQFSLFS